MEMTQKEEETNTNSLRDRSCRILSNKNMGFLLKTRNRIGQKVKQPIKSIDKSPRTKSYADQDTREKLKILTAQLL